MLTIHFPFKSRYWSQPVRGHELGGGHLGAYLPGSIWPFVVRPRSNCGKASRVGLNIIKLLRNYRSSSVQHVAKNSLLAAQESQRGRPALGGDGGRAWHRLWRHWNQSALRLWEAIKAGSAGGSFTPQAVLGVVSLIIWSLLLIVSLKYAVLILRADNRGEGGTWRSRALRHGTRTSGNLAQ